MVGPGLVVGWSLPLGHKMRREPAFCGEHGAFEGDFFNFAVASISSKMPLNAKSESFAGLTNDQPSGRPWRRSCSRLPVPEAKSGRRQAVSSKRSKRAIGRAGNGAHRHTCTHRCPQTLLRKRACRVEARVIVRPHSEWEGLSSHEKPRYAPTASQNALES